MIVIGAGRVGTALTKASLAAGIDCSLVSRNEGWDALKQSGGLPIVLCVRNDDLAEVVRKVPRTRLQDLVIVQNGAVSDWLGSNNLGEVTRGLLYFAVAKLGDPVEVSETPSPFTGRHAGTMRVWFEAMHLPATELIWPNFLVEEGVKLGWLLAHGLLCELYDMDVGTIATERRAELTQVVKEICAVWRAARGVDMNVDWVVDRLCTYSMSIPTYRASVKEWRWRNGWMDQAARRYRVPTPLHREFLRVTGHDDKL